MSAWIEKFIGYVDIVGYSALTNAVEAQNGVTDDDLVALAKMLGSDSVRRNFQEWGPTTCPQAPRLRDDLDFQLGQFSDCVVVSTEVSPAGSINLVSHCFGACIQLLSRGVMCRGYIKKGNIFHEGLTFRGTGLVDAVSKEKVVSFFRTDADEIGTPFIEIDPEVVAYVANQSDKCVGEMFSRMVMSHDGLTAVFPFKRLRHSWIISSSQRFDAEEEKRRNNSVREGIKGLKEKVRQFASGGGASAVRKSEHYLRALEQQLAACDQTDALIDQLVRPWPAHRITKDTLPGLHE